MPTIVHRTGRRLLGAVHIPITLYLAKVGVDAFIEGPVTATTRLVSPWLSYVWASALIVGAVLIVVGVAADRSRTESVGHGFHLFGLGLLAVIVVTRHDGAGADGLVVLAAVVLLRMRILTKSRAAHREAQRIGGP